MSYSTVMDIQLLEFIGVIGNAVMGMLDGKENGFLIFCNLLRMSR